MILLRQIMRWLSGTRSFDPGVIDRAEADNVLGDHGRILRRLEASSEALKASQRRLLESIGEAKSSTEKATRQNRDGIANHL